MLSPFDTGSLGVQKFVIAVCTARRPKMLQRCLESLVRLSVPAGAHLQIVVIENSPEPTAEDIVAEVRRQADIAIHYRTESRPGIPFARNAALDLSNALGADWIGLIDDDEFADPDWLVKLHGACIAFAADVANGPVDQICEGMPPEWWESRTYPDRATGKQLRGAPTNNILMRASLIRKDGLALRFDERLVSGSEDVEFFRHAVTKGARIVWVADAWLHEVLPASRLTPKKLLARAYMVATSQTRVSQIRRGRFAGVLVLLPKILRRLIVGSFALAACAVVWLIRPAAGKFLFYSGAFRIVKAAGNILGSFGYSGDYYKSIEGR